MKDTFQYLRLMLQSDEEINEYVNYKIKIG
jgi:hypothetical protein